VSNDPNPRPARRGTLAAIAQEVGVAVSTVSYVLNGKHRQARISAARVEQILAVARQHEYRPNAAAVAMRRGRFDAIGLAVSDVTGRHSLPGDLIDAILTASQAHGLHVVLGRCSDEQFGAGGDLPRLLREWSVDGLLINHLRDFTPELIERVRGERIPSIWINIRLDADCVHPDDLAGAAAAVDHLAGLGHRRIAYATLNASRHYSHADRRDGYGQAMARRGLAPQPFIAATDVPQAQRLEAYAAWLARPDRPTAVVTYADDDALPLLAAAFRLGLRVPQDLSVVAIHDQPLDALGLAVTTWRIPGKSLGERAVAMLREKLAEPGLRLPPCALPFTRVDGATVAPPGAD
jgi:LacI family transcriptional regulator